MASYTGTSSNDSLKGSLVDDSLFGLEGDDVLEGGGGNDVLDGGEGNDIIFGDLNVSFSQPVYFYNNKYYTLSALASRTNPQSWSLAQANAVSLGGNLVTINDAAENQFLVQKFGSESLWIGLTDRLREGFFKWEDGDQASYKNWYLNRSNNSSSNDYVVFNFGNPGKWGVTPGGGNGRPRRGIIEIGSSNDTIIGSSGNDSIDGGLGLDTADYSNIGEAITLRPTWSVDKGTAGTDQLVNIEQIIGATGQANLIDASTATGSASINANLETQSLVLNTGDTTSPTQTLGVSNFTDVVGTVNNDVITGDAANNQLVGWLGQDRLNGGAGSDAIFGDFAGESFILSYNPVFTYNNKYYTLSTSYGTWPEVQAEAVRLGGNLVTVNDAAENQFLVDTFSGAGSLWIGLTDEGMEGSFQWVNGEEASYSNWALGEPNNVGEEDYAQIYPDGQWNDLPGYYWLNGIIEIDASNDTIIASSGDDSIDGGLGLDTADYSSIGEAITLRPTWSVDKGTAGTDQLVNIEQIVGATDQANLIDASSATGSTSINANLETQSLILNTGDTTSPTQSLGVSNFTDVVGTINNDVIIGDAANNQLVGWLGQDRLNGGAGSDAIFGDVGGDVFLSLINPVFTYNNKYYTLSTTYGTWSEVQAEAIRLGGNLVTVNDAAENQFLVDTFSGAGSLWIGLTDEGMEGSFQWVNGEEASYSNWALGEPNNVGEEDYAQIYPDGQWNDLPWVYWLNGIIEIDGSNDTIIASSGDDSIDGGLGLDTADYSSIGEAITLKPTWLVDKGTAGTDQLVGIEQIVAATGQANLIDASSATGSASINANLETQSLVLNTGDTTSPTQSLGVSNFTAVVGTVNNDVITGDAANNQLVGWLGQDRLSGGAGSDAIFGDVAGDAFLSAANSVFTYNNKYYTLSTSGRWSEAQAEAVRLGGNLVTVNDAAENQFLLDAFGGLERLWLGLTDETTEGSFQWANGEEATYSNWAPFQPDNYNYGFGDEDYVEFNGGGAGLWNDLPDAGPSLSGIFLKGIIEIAGSNDTIIGSSGDDSMDGGLGLDTADYSSIGQAIILKPAWVVDKGTAGTDQLVDIEQVVGATGQFNVIDASTATGSASINANLETQSLILNTGDATSPTQSVGVSNFVAVIGTVNNDVITGDAADNYLFGWNGNDMLNGGAGSDFIVGDFAEEAFILSHNPVFTYNNKYYTLSTSYGTWSEVQAEAVRLGGNLVTMNDAAENQFLLDAFGDSERLWLGLTDETTEGAFQWANGEEASYSNWAPFQPDNYNYEFGDEDYVEFNGGGAGLWNDLPGSGYLLRGIVEIDGSNDTLQGGLGSDSLIGGLGNDVFRYSRVAESRTGATTQDTIMDFQLGVDTLDLRSIDANPFLSMNQAFSFRGRRSTFTDVGQLRYQLAGDDLFLYGNTDSNLATAELKIQMHGLASISASSIML